jgi:F-type H+-transporting ATPase subunit gamma
MANLRDIRRRIKSVKSTSQITKAMELVAAAKMKKAQDQALAGRGYADKLNKVLVTSRITRTKIPILSLLSVKEARN